ncbi:MAG: glycoside hydrolase family 9 protein [Spirochaetales bacterium]|nr:glycoside hydrolase family 9 protein [Spirochaetales bacterium]
MKTKITAGFILILAFFLNLPLFSQDLGDVNHDQKVNIVDALLIAQYYVQMPLETFYPEAADVDCSAVINIVDSLLVAQFYVGVIPELPCGAENTPTPSPPSQTAVPETGPYNYGEALQKAIFFYKAQRSGDLPHDYPLIWRGDSGMTDGQDVGLDLTGGWYDAGDHVKFNLPMAFSAAQLGWAVYEYREAFESAGQLDIILDEIKWTTDYLIKCHPEPDTYYFQCGLGDSDHGFWGPPEVIHLTTDRSSSVVNPSRPGSDAAGQAAAALAIASIIFEKTDPAYADLCLSHARDLHKFADTYRGFYPIKGYYPSGSYLDDIGWAAIWLYLKTSEEKYLENAKTTIGGSGMIGGLHTLCWDDVSYGVVLKLAQITEDPLYVQGIETSLNFWLPGGGVVYTPGGLAWKDTWGSLRYASGAAFLAFVWAEIPVGTAAKKEAYRDFAIGQMNYILGDNPNDMSYVVGFGKNPPQHPHHKAAHGSWLSQLDTPAYHRHTLYGALVGGPDNKDFHNDDITDYTMNEVADDYNAAFTGCMARMYSLYGGVPIPGFPRTEDFRPINDRLPELFVRGFLTGEYAPQANIHLQMDNRTAWPARVIDTLSARYFIDISEIVEAGFGANDLSAAVQVEDGAVVTGPHKWSGNIYYFEIDFSGTLIYPGGWEESEKDCQFNLIHPLNVWNSANDWSAQEIETKPDYNAKTFFGMTPYIPVYENGKLVFGQEPPK